MPHNLIGDAPTSHIGSASHQQFQSHLRHRFSVAAWTSPAAANKDCASKICFYMHDAKEFQALYDPNKVVYNRFNATHSPEEHYDKRLITMPIEHDTILVSAP
jgi:hypothetical protein